MSEDAITVRLMPIAERYEYAELYVFPRPQEILDEGERLWCLIGSPEIVLDSGTTNGKNTLTLYNGLGASGWLIDALERTDDKAGSVWLSSLANRLMRELNLPGLVFDNVYFWHKADARRRLID